MARSQFTFKFANAQPGAAVTFSAAVYSSPVDAVADGPTLALDSQRTVAVWTDAAELTATWVDGAGASIMAEASLTRPVVTATGGVPGSAPTAASGPAVGLLSARPAATGSNTTYYATDVGLLYEDTATGTWTQIAGGVASDHLYLAANYR